MQIPKRQQPIQVAAHWIFDPAHVESGSIGEGELVLADVSGGGNSMELVVTDEAGIQPISSLLSWTECARGEVGLTFRNDSLQKGQGCYFRTVKDASLNEQKFPRGYTIEAIVKMPEPFNEDKHSWMGVLTRGGRGADLGNSGENELLATLSVSNCKEFQWVCHPENGTSSATNWSRYLDPAHWHHVVIVNDTEQTLLYVDGVCDYNSPLTGISGIAAIAGQGWNIGASEWGGRLDQLFSGSMKQIRIAAEPLAREDWLLDSSPLQVLQGTNEELPLLQSNSMYQFVLIPDPQKLVYLNPEMFEAQDEVGCRSSG